MDVDWRMVGRRIRSARKERGWTQETLAEKADISASFLGHIERETRLPSADTVYRLCQQLGISMDSLFAVQARAVLSSLDKADRVKVMELLQCAFDIIAGNGNAH